MKCLKCGYLESKVIDSRLSEDRAAIRRRRECLKCKYRFTTYENIELTPVLVIKKNNLKQKFCREKIIKGVTRACVKRAVSVETIEDLVNQLEQELNSLFIREITSDEIGERVLRKLKDIDEIAYIRFASVYKQFSNIDEFRKELNNLK